MSDYLLNRGDVLGVVDFGSVGLAPINQMFHNGYPKYRNVPSSVKLAGALWYMFLGGTAPGEIERFFAHSPKMTSACIRLFLKDHTYDRLNRVREQLQDFVKTHVTPDPELSQVKVHFLGGDSGLYLAANDVLYRLDIVNITFVLVVIYLCCAFSFRSLIAGALFIVSAVMANFGAFIYMNARGIGLTIDTIPVISLGIGLGIDYGIYIVARIQDEVIGGATVEDADHHGAQHHRRRRVQHLCRDGGWHPAVGVLAAAVPQRDERAADLSDGHQHDRGMLDPAFLHRLAPAALHHPSSDCAADGGSAGRVVVS